MKPCRMTWPRRSVAALSLGLWTWGTILVLKELQSGGQGLFAGALILGLLGWLGLSYRLMKTFSLYSLDEDTLLVHRGFWVGKWDLKTLQKIQESPGKGLLILYFRDGRVEIPRRLRGYAHLKSRLASWVVSGNPAPPFQIAAVKSPLVFFLAMEVLLTGFFFTVAGAVSPGTGWTALLAGVAFLAALVLFRVLFLLPLKYVLDQEGIQVRYLLHKKYFPAAAALDLVEDLYHADGAPFHLVKLVFRKRNLVLDEFNLASPINHLLPWIRKNYGPAARSTF